MGNLVPMLGNFCNFKSRDIWVLKQACHISVSLNSLTFPWYDTIFP